MQLRPAGAETPQAAPPAAGPAEQGAAAPTAPAAPAPAAETPAEVPSGELPIKATVPIVYLGKEYEEPLPLSYAEKPITDKGIQGARLIIKEANQAGTFVGFAFELVEAIVPANGDVVAKAKEILAKGDAFIIADLEAEGPDRRRRSARGQELDHRQHPLQRRGAPPGALPLQRVPYHSGSGRMRADALGQYLIWKKWPRWF